MLTAPSGYPEVLTISPRRSVVSGSCGGGFSVMVAPHAIAGAILCAARSTGKLNGVIAAIGDSGKRRVQAIGDLAQHRRARERRHVTTGARRSKIRVDCRAHLLGPRQRGNSDLATVLRRANDSGFAFSLPLLCRHRPRLSTTVAAMAAS